ncbi:MAG: hypothetical protein JWP25_7610 [Bradyrhizobium sp.]|nr:hypothetical protein [Bradyrhizobium sp.]
MSDKSRVRWIYHLSPRAGRGRIALAIRVRGSLRKLAHNRFKNSRYIAQHIVVPESQNTIIMIEKPFVAHYIARVFGVLASIDLNNEATIAADKVDRVWTYRILPDEFVSIEPTRPQPIPKRTLGIRCGLSQTPGSFGLHLIGSAHAAAPPHPDCFAIQPLPARGERLASPAKT